MPGGLEDVARLERKLDQVIVMLAGDPLLTDPKEAGHTENSIMGRLRSGDRRMDTIEQRQAEAVAKLVEAIETLQKNKFGWDTSVRPFLQKNWKWFALIFGLGLLEMYRMGLGPFN